MNKTEATIDDIGIGVLICATATFGIIFNGFGFIIVVNNSVLATTFGRLCLNHCVANFFACIVFLLWVAPMTLVQDINLSTSSFGKVMGQINTFFWDVSIYSHLFVSIDRMISISCPLKNFRFLTYYRSWVIVVFPLLWALGSIVPFFWYSSCYDTYHPDLWQWKYASTKCGRILPRIHFVKNCTLLAIMGALDMITLIFLRRHHKFIKSSIADGNQAVQTTRRKREIRFFVQVQIFYNGKHFPSDGNPSTLNSSKLYEFFFITYSWELCHTFDGLVLCIFQLKSYEKQRRTTLNSIRSQTTVRSCTR